jgi:hypothetical protein
MVQGTWQQPSRSGVAAIVVALLAALLIAGLGSPGAGAATAGGREVEVIVREAAGAGGRPEALVEQLGGTVGRPLDSSDGFTATVPAAALGRLRVSRVIHSVTENQPVRLNSIGGC